MIKTVLIVEDTPDLNEYLRELFVEAGFSVLSSTSGVRALKLVEKTPPDLVVLDLGLPDVKGETVLKQIKDMFPDMPIIVLTAKAKVAEIVSGFKLGADDYMTKPFSGEELIARVKARLRESNNHNSKLLVADLELDREALQVRRGKKEIPLTKKEFQLLEFLMINKGRVLTREIILNKVWYYSLDVETRVVDVYIGYLRKKIDKEFDKKLIHSVKGFGYLVKD
jgi:DNA-binding response OmpR family regulator